MQYTVFPAASQYGIAVFAQYIEITLLYKIRFISLSESLSKQEKEERRNLFCHKRHRMIEYVIKMQLFIVYEEL